MIKIDLIRISEFRGIRDLTLKMGGRNFAACGPNGTGKSGIVDAIEFALTGTISRLAGTGTGNLSVKAHGPHVDSRDKPSSAFVELDVIIPSLSGKKARIRRSVDSAASPTITPNTPDIVEVFERVAAHPEFVLSRRELIRYVLAEPGQRSKEVQALMRLGDLEKVRTSLQRIANRYEKELAPLERAEADAAKLLRTALDTADLSRAGLLLAVNPHRATLGLQPLTELTAGTSLKDGLASAAGPKATRVAKTQATADLLHLRESLANLGSAAFATACQAATAAANELKGDAALLTDLDREALLQSALRLYDGEACPVCDKPYGPDEFRGHIDEKLKHLEQVAKKRANLELLIRPLLEGLSAAGTGLKGAIDTASMFEPRLDSAKLDEARLLLRSYYGQLQKLLPLDETIEAIRLLVRPLDLAEALQQIEAAVAGLPEPSKQDAARDFLTVSQERLEQYREARLRLAEGRLRSDRASKASELFGAVSTKALEALYKEVEAGFTECYRKINHEDEGEFTAKLLPSVGKLGFDVDFYGRGHFPPGAYHSEGHQDGMGLCLYLALMRHLLGVNFTFAVLDDVLMSVDSGHRREVCTLLKEVFPGTQFVFTTHDEIWLKHMQSEGLIKDRDFRAFQDVERRRWAD